MVKSTSDVWNPSRLTTTKGKTGNPDAASTTANDGHANNVERIVNVVPNHTGANQCG